MPRYQYECECGKEFEEIRPMKDYKKPIKCKCGKNAQLAITAPALAGFNHLGQSTGRAFG
jgi:putative FmdB family regulatory protein